MYLMQQCSQKETTQPLLFHTELVNVKRIACSNSKVGVLKKHHKMTIALTKFGGMYYITPFHFFLVYLIKVVACIINAKGLHCEEFYSTMILLKVYNMYLLDLQASISCQVICGHKALLYLLHPLLCYFILRRENKPVTMTTLPSFTSH